MITENPRRLVIIILLAILIFSAFFLIFINKFPSRDTSHDQMMPAIFVINLNIKNNTAYIIGIDVENGYGPNYIQSGQFKVDIINKTGEVIQTISLMDPRIRLGQEVVYVDDQDFSVIFPFSTDVSMITLFDTVSNKHLISIDLSKTIADFCYNHKEDVDCSLKCTVGVNSCHE